MCCLYGGCIQSHACPFSSIQSATWFTSLQMIVFSVLTKSKKWKALLISCLKNVITWKLFRIWKKKKANHELGQVRSAIEIFILAIHIFIHFSNVQINHILPSYLFQVQKEWIIFHGISEAPKMSKWWLDLKWEVASGCKRTMRYSHIAMNQRDYQLTSSDNTERSSFCVWAIEGFNGLYEKSEWFWL